MTTYDCVSECTIMKKTGKMGNSFIDLRVTKKDFIGCCQSGDFKTILSTCKKLAGSERGLINDERAVHVVEQGCIEASLLSSSRSRPQTMVISSFAKAVESVGGKPIFAGFISENERYVNGAIIPIGQYERILVYLPTNNNVPKVLFSRGLTIRFVQDFLLELNKAWKDDLVDRLELKPFVT